MAITPISPTIILPIASEAVNIDIAPTSKYGQSYDVARITTLIRLTNPLLTPQRFLLPKADAFSDPTISLEDGKKLNFSVDAIDAGALNKLKQEFIQKAQNYISTVNSDNANTIKQLTDEIYELQQMTTAEEVPAGTRLIKFSYTKPVNQVNNTFTLDTIVPLASFSLQNGGKIHALIAMPFDPNVPSSYVHGTWTNTFNQQQVLQSANIPYRTVLYAYWQQDPKLVVTYHY